MECGRRTGSNVMKEPEKGNWEDKFWDCMNIFAAGLAENIAKELPYGSLKDNVDLEVLRLQSLCDKLERRAMKKKENRLGGCGDFVQKVADHAFYFALLIWLLLVAGDFLFKYSREF
jgi:hypothetical protein